MSDIVRIYRCRSLPGIIRAVSAAELADTIEISSAMLKGDTTKLRDQLHVQLQPGLLGKKLCQRVQIRRSAL